MNRYVYPTFKRPEMDPLDYIKVGSRVRIKNKSIVAVREHDIIPTSNVGTVVRIDEGQYNGIKVQHGHAEIRNWGWRDVEPADE